MNSFLIKSGLFVCAATIYTSTARAADTDERIYELKGFVVSAGPVARPVEDFATPFAVLDEAALRREGGSNLGELLDGQPGVSSTSFGAGASRPIIRGFDGPRVRILDSGLEAIDVSDTSPDHAVSVEPLLLERVEVLRGPSTLLYGSSAIGGVVNVIGRELAREPVDPKGYAGAFEGRYDSVSESRTAVGYTTVGGEQWALRVTGLKRETEDYTIPGKAEIHTDDEDDGSGGELENSFVETDAYSAGGTWFFGGGHYLGFAYSRFESLYGVPGHGHDEEEEEEDDDHDEEFVSIDLERSRYDAVLNLIEPIGWIEAARMRFGYTDYEHTELEGAETGTIFEREGWELRGEIAHAPIGIFESGIWGIQFSDTDFSAVGEEAFTPPATTRNQAIFLSEHIHRGALHWEFGGRLERQSVDPEGIEDSYSDVAASVAASAIWDIDEHHSLALSLQRSQRHPSSTELYADGAHLATEQYEIGESELELETAYGVDLTYRYVTDEWSAAVSVFYTQFEDFIYAEETGAELDELPVFQFESVDARFWGFEGEVEYTAYRSDTVRLSYRLVADYVDARNLDSGEDLPRIPPLRIGGGVRLESGAWDAGVFLRHALQQKKTAPNETQTDGYTELSLDLARSISIGNGDLLTLFARADNLLDEDIRIHSSFLKDIAPLPGRNLTVGVRYEF